MLKLHTSNRLETLAQRLAEAIQRPLRSGLQSASIVVQRQGMARWLKLELAGRQGNCANCALPFPKVFCSQVLAANSAGPGGGPALDREMMLWEIMRVLPEMLNGPEFSPLKSYLSDAADLRKRFQLSSQIANLFDQYLGDRK